MPDSFPTNKVPEFLWRVHHKEPLVLSLEGQPPHIIPVTQSLGQITADLCRHSKKMRTQINAEVSVVSQPQYSSSLFFTVRIHPSGEFSQIKRLRSMVCTSQMSCCQFDFLLQKDLNGKLQKVIDCSYSEKNLGCKANLGLRLLFQYEKLPGQSKKINTPRSNEVEFS